MPQPKPFDYINNLSSGKANIDDLTGHNAFLTNRFFSYFLDTILDSNKMNMASCLSSDTQYSYYFNKIRKKKRFSKWHKPTAIENIDMISEYYEVNKQRAGEILFLLSSDDIEYIKNKLNKGGVTK